MTIRSRWPLYMLSMLAANLIGAVLVFAFVRYGVPIPESDAIVADRVRNFAIFGVYLAFAGCRQPHRGGHDVAVGHPLAAARWSADAGPSRWRHCTRRCVRPSCTWCCGFSAASSSCS